MIFSHSLGDSAALVIMAITGNRKSIVPGLKEMVIYLY